MSVNGIVLAGGLSTRMGRDKALLPWQGRTLLEHMRGLLMQAGAREVWVSGNYPAFGGVPDRVARCGPLGGLYSVAMRMPDGPAWWCRWIRRCCRRDCCSNCVTAIAVHARSLPAIPCPCWWI